MVPPVSDPLQGASASRFKMVVTVHLLFSRNNAVLMLRRYHTGWGDGLYSVPAGHLDGEETVREAAAREAWEECGVRIAPTPWALGLAGVMHRRSNDREQIDFFLDVRHFEGDPYNREPEKCDQLAWMPREDLPHNTVPYIRTALSQPRSHPWFLEHGWGAQ
jgi:8-oxo-dGTP diphosphatase